MQIVTPAVRARSSSAAPMEKGKRKFLRVFPGGFRDDTYLAWERDYKWQAHKEWDRLLNPFEMQRLMATHAWQELAQRAVKIESSRSLLFSFEKMALRDAVRSEGGAEIFARGLFKLLHGSGALEQRFEAWVAAIEQLPRKQTRVLTWPLVTVFAFIAQPRTHIFLKPNTTKEAARKLGLEFNYLSRPNWPTYHSYLDLAQTTKQQIRDLKPRDMIDIQSFLWIQGSDEYR